MSLNKVILIGNVGKDPQIRYLDNGVSVANLLLATHERGYIKKGGEKVPDRTEWHNVVLWRGLAELADKSIIKGQLLCIEGKLKTRYWEDKEGNKNHITEIYAENMQILGKRKNREEHQDQKDDLKEMMPEFGENLSIKDRIDSEEVSI